VEETIESLQDFVICFWQMKPRSSDKVSVTNIIVADGCIDLIVNFDDKQIGYAGMSKTNFHYTIDLPTRFLGTRLKPGAFEQLTKIPAKRAMDTFFPLNKIDANFDTDYFFSLQFEQASMYLKNYLQQLASNKTPNIFVGLFDKLSKSPPATTTALYQMLHFSPRQCQRLFMKHFGITPQMALSIIRFQHCLGIITFGQTTPNSILELTSFYDQSHFIRDFKRNIGLTPFEYLRKYKD